MLGLGSVYAKTMRESRRRFWTLTAVMAVLVVLVCAGIPKAYPTQAARDEMARLATHLGSAVSGLAGRPVNVGSLGGYLQWKYGAAFLWIVAVWLVLSLSATLAGEAGSGALHLVATTPVGRRRLAVQKVGAHLTLVAVSLLVLALAVWVGAAAFGNLPGDSVSVGAALGYSLWVALMSVAFGALALVLSLVLGRAVGAGLAGAVLFAGWILSGYANSIPGFGWAAKLTPWEWTAGHLPLAGQADWWSLLPVALVAAGLLALGVEVFVRRDLGTARARHLPQGPSVTLGLRGPVGRSFGERLPAGLAWATGAGLFGLAMAAGSKSFADQLDQSPDLTRTFSSLFPGLDMRTAGGFLQLVFVQLGFVIIGFAAVTLVAGWASDETSGRLETVLSAPLSRPSWALASAAGIGGVVMVMTVVLAAGVGIGSAAAGSGIARPVSGALALGLYALALTGVGAALLGLRARAAAPTLAVLVSATFVIDLFAPGLHLPRWVDGLALTTHLGQPMLGRWDWVGVAACLVLAVAGTGSGAVAVQRRDL